ncbi:MAG: hypothetical protein ACYC4U_11315 [Pirellulaceae bacterium]
MSRSLAISVVVVAVLLVGGWVLAVQEQEPAPAPSTSEQWVVSSGGDATVLLEANTGKTWVLHRSHSGIPTWLAAARMDDPARVQQYLHEEGEYAVRAGKSRAK